MFAICSENIPVLSFLLSQKSINLQQTVPSSGFSLLHIAAATNKSAQVTETLLKFNMLNVNAVDRTGRTALHVAAQNGNRDIVKLLLRKNAAIDAQTLVRLTSAI
jgi:ankyrin repeat protein